MATLWLPLYGACLLGVTQNGYFLATSNVALCINKHIHTQQHVYISLSRYTPIQECYIAIRIDLEVPPLGGIGRAQHFF